MQTAIGEHLLAESTVKHSEGIFRSCVHCGFCNATCPTYRLTGNELEGPRGRIYLMKSVLEERAPLNATVVSHLDSCLSCLSCESTCPSGVRYSHLIDTMRIRIERNYRRPLLERLKRASLAWMLPHPGRFRFAMKVGAIARSLLRPISWMLPYDLRSMLVAIPAKVPPPSKLSSYEVHVAQGARKARVALLTGCAQQVLGGRINEATIRLLTRIGCEVVLPKDVGCCGALVYHMGNEAGSLPHMRQTIDAWHAEIERGGLDHIVINTSGCGTVVRDYGHIFRDDPQYAEKAARISALSLDFSEIVHQIGLPEDAHLPSHTRIAYHDACSLQHGQKVRSQPRAVLRDAGFEVLDIPQGHLCCGSAGTYNLLHPRTAEELGRMKAGEVEPLGVRAIAAGNIGCMEQIARYTKLPVLHTAELLDWATGGASPEELLD